MLRLRLSQPGADIGIDARQAAFGLAGHRSACVNETPHSPQLKVPRSARPPVPSVMRVRCIDLPQFGQIGRNGTWSPTCSPTCRVNDSTSDIAYLYQSAVFKRTVEIQTPVRGIGGPERRRFCDFSAKPLRTCAVRAALPRGKPARSLPGRRSRPCAWLVDCACAQTVAARKAGLTATRNLASAPAITSDCYSRDSPWQGLIRMFFVPRHIPYTCKAPEPVLEPLRRDSVRHTFRICSLYESCPA
jgi:hypothetical protein